MAENRRKFCTDIEVLLAASSRLQGVGAEELRRQELVLMRKPKLLRRREDDRGAMSKPNSVPSAFVPYDPSRAVPPEQGVLPTAYLSTAVVHGGADRVRPRIWSSIPKKSSS